MRSFALALAIVGLSCCLGGCAGDDRFSPRAQWDGDIIEGKLWTIDGQSVTVCFLRSASSVSRHGFRDREGAVNVYALLDLESRPIVASSNDVLVRPITLAGKNKTVEPRLIADDGTTVKLYVQIPTNPGEEERFDHHYFNIVLSRIPKGFRAATADDLIAAE